MKSLTLIFLCLTAIALILFCLTEDKHNCKWKLCPYKGITEAQYKEAVTNYTGEEGTDSWCIDMLHLEHPKAEYEELEAMLFGNMKH